MKFQTTRTARIFLRLPQHESEMLKKELEQRAIEDDAADATAEMLAVGWGIVTLVLAAVALLHFALS